MILSHRKKYVSSLAHWEDRMRIENWQQVSTFMHDHHELCMIAPALHVPDNIPENKFMAPTDESGDKVIRLLSIL